MENIEYKINKYKSILLAENEKYNLVSRKTIADEIDLHIKDSLEITKLIDISGRKLVDIGSGAGFPALIIAMYFNSSYFLLVEAEGKKSNFLNLIKNELSLDNVTIEKRRAEEIGKLSQYREKFNLCTSRAVGKISLVAEYGMPLLCLGGQLILWKGKNYMEEIEQSENALSELGGEIETIHEYKLNHLKDRALVIIRKNKLTPKKYPRNIGIPSKRPL